MKQFGILQAIVLSFFSPDLYRDVARRWKGVGVIYLLVLLAICWLPSAVRGFLGLQTFATSAVPRMVAQLPDLRIVDGVMHATPPGRHVLSDPDPTNPRDDTPIVIIDDTIDDVPSDIDLMAIVVTRREFAVVRPKRSERRVYRFAPTTNMDITRAKVAGFLASLRFWMPPTGYLLAVIGSLLFRIVQALIYANVALMFARSVGTSLDFRAAMRLAAIAVTPVIVLRTLIWFGPWEPGWYVRWPIAIVVTILYLRFAVNAAAAEPPVESPAVAAAPY